MNVKIVTKRLQFIFGEIKNVQSSESPSEFLRNTKAQPASFTSDVSSFRTVVQVIL